MAKRKVSRVDLDRADSPIISGAKTVFVNNKSAAHEGSTTVKGAVVVQGARGARVYVENKPIARAGDRTTKGPIQSGSSNVFAGDKE